MTRYTPVQERYAIKVSSPVGKLSLIVVRVIFEPTLTVCETSNVNSAGTRIKQKMVKVPRHVRLFRCTSEKLLVPDMWILVHLRAKLFTWILRCLSVVEHHNHHLVERSQSYTINWKIPSGNSVYHLLQYIVPCLPLFNSTATMLFRSGGSKLQNEVCKTVDFSGNQPLPTVMVTKLDQIDLATVLQFSAECIELPIWTVKTIILLRNHICTKRRWEQKTGIFKSFKEEQKRQIENISTKLYVVAGKMDGSLWAQMLHRTDRR